MLLLVPVMEALAVSVAVMVWLPAVTKVSLKLPVPLLKVLLPGKMALINRVNRSDIWRAAAKGLGVAAPTADSRGKERFFDGKVFDPQNPEAYLGSQPIKKLV